jgi:DNA-binding transcriptional MocR family regulator
MEDAIFRGIANKIRNEINKGVHGPGDQLPGARALARKYVVGSDTIKWAFRLLANEGLLVISSRGTFVAPKHQRESVVILPAGTEIIVRMPSPNERRTYDIPFVGIPIFVVRAPGEPDRIYPGHAVKLVTEAPAT